VADRDPSDFPGNPNPPAKAPQPAKAPAAPKAPATSAGTGALPPESGPSADATPFAKADGPSFSVSEGENGTHDVFSMTDDGPQKLGTSIWGKKDLDSVMGAAGAVYDKDRGVYENVPENVAKVLSEGPQSLASEVKHRLNAGMIEFHRASLGLALAGGDVSAEDFRQRTHPDLVQLQLDRHPAQAWHGLGNAVSKFMEHPVDEGEDILKHSISYMAEQLPALSDLAGKATLGTAAGGMLAAFAGPEMIPLGMKAGGMAGTFLSLYQQELGARMATLADRGLGDKDIHKQAPAEAVKSAVGAAIFMYGVDAMAAPFKARFLQSLGAETEAAKKLTEKAASWAYNYGVNAGIKMPAVGVVHQMAADLMDNMSALVEKRPDLMKSPLDFSNNAIEAAAGMAKLGAIAGVPGAVFEAGGEAIKGMSGRFQNPLEPGGGRRSSSRPGQGPSESSAPASETAHTATASPTPGEASPSSNPSVSEAPTSPESITPESVKSNAEKDARPFLEEHAAAAGADPKDPKFALDLYRKHNNAIHMAKEELGIGKDLSAMTPEEKVELMQRLREMPPEQKERIEKTLAESAPIVAALQRKVNIDMSPEAADIWAARDAAAARAAAEEAGASARTAEPEPEPEPEAPTPKEREFFRPSTITGEVKANDAETGREGRLQLVADRNEQIARVNQKMRAFRAAVPDELDRQAATWWVDAGGDRAQLAAMLEDPKLKEYHAQIERALNLPEAAQRWAETSQRYFTEAAEVGQERGTLQSARENYVNRLYKPEKENDFVQGGGATKGAGRSTVHGRERVFETMADAVRGGKEFATTDLADLVTNYNSDLARANANRALADTWAEKGLGAWVRTGKIPKGWAEVGFTEKTVPILDKEGQPVMDETGSQHVSRSVFVAPEGIAKQMRAVFEPNFVQKIDALRGIQRYQGIVKTVDLSMSLFHHVSMLAQLAYAGDMTSLLDTVKMDKVLNHPDFALREQDFVKHGGETAVVSDNADILRRLTRDEGDTFSKVVNLPGVKQVLQGADKSAEFLFGKVQRLWKVNAFSKLAADWVVKNPEATNEQTTAAMRDLARHVNDRFGGQNWEALGMTKSNLALLRIGLLAPDWTLSNLHLLKAAIGEGGAGGRASRVHILSSLVVGMATTEAFNVAMTGHTTDKNEKGHELEVEIAPNVYVSLLRGGVHDIAMMASLVRESGLAGVARFGQGKLSPFARTGVGLASNVNYAGKTIAKRGEGPVANTYDVLKFALSSAAPVPLGVSNLLQYAQDEDTPMTATGAAAVGLGVGRFAKPRK
jgi:hypothetical protein